MVDIQIKAASTGDMPAVAAVRWRWVHENKAEPPDGKESFLEDFATWAARQSHRCSVLTGNGEVMGMAWLAEVARPPSPGALARACGDLQSVYVVPELRGRGWGRQLVAHALQVADDLGMECVSVHSGAAALNLYLSTGFVHDPRLLLRPR